MRTVKRDTGCIQLSRREDHLEEAKSWGRTGEKWEESPSLGRRRINFSSFAYQLNWGKHTGRCLVHFLLWGLSRSRCYLISFWSSFAAARWGKEGVNDIGWISVLRVTWKSSGFTMPGRRGTVLHYLWRYRVSLTALYYTASTVVFTFPNWDQFQRNASG